MSSGSRAFLCPVDDTEDSKLAVEWVIKEMYRPDDVLHLYHCTPTPSPDVMQGLGLMEGIVTYQPDPDCNQQLISAAKSMVDSRFVPLLKDSKVKYEVHLAAQHDLEPVGQAICGMAIEVDAFAVVMMSHKKSKLVELFLGSVSKYTTTHTRGKRAVIVLH